MFVYLNFAYITSVKACIIPFFLSNFVDYESYWNHV